MVRLNVTEKVKSELDSLVDELERQTTLNEELLGCCERQTVNLVNNNKNDLESNSVNMENLINRVNRSKTVSDSKVQNIAALCGLDRSITYDGLANELGNNGTDLNKWLGKLSGLVAEMASTNFRNALMTGQAMNIQSFNLNALSLKADTTPIYGSKGEINKKDNLFLDKKV